jgi:hypothetical protein
VLARDQFYVFDSMRPLLHLRAVPDTTWLLGLTNHRILLW